MMNRKTMVIILVSLLVAVVLLVAGRNSEAVTSPKWVGNDITTGKTAIADSVYEASVALSMIQVIETSSWKGSFWGRNRSVSDSTWVQITPTKASDGDTTLAPPAGAFFYFNSIRLEVIVTESGTATFWGE